MDSGPPTKRYLKIGEVSRLTSLNSSVLRFWETEFEMLRPLKSSTGQRLYSKDDVELVFRIKKLLYEEKLTIAGARSRISSSRRSEETQQRLECAEQRRIQLLKDIKRELEILKDSL